MITQKHLKELLSYDPETGEFRWAVSPTTTVSKGSLAGTINDRGRRQIRIEGKFYYASRLAWFYMTGVWPENEVDHENRIRSDDRWKNLRPATRSQNACNKKMPSTNKSGVMGVCWHRKRKKWRAHIVLNKKQISLGSYDTVEEAAAARAAAVKKYHGEYAP